MSHKCKAQTRTLNLELSLAVADSMVALDAALQQLIHARALGAILYSEKHGVTLLLPPQYLDDPVQVKELLNDIRHACDLYEQELVTRKLQ